MIEILAAADSHWTWTLFGRLHPLTVHFPIALLLVAAVVEGWSLLKKKPAAESCSWICCWMGALSAIVATVMGYSFANENGSGKILELHERLGLITCALAAITTALAWRARKAGGRGGPAMAYRGFLFVSAMAVGATGHFGGEMVYSNWLVDGMPWDPDKKAPLQKPPEPPPKADVPTAEAVDFVKDIAPVIKESCLKCHGPKKVKGKVQLDKKELAFKKGLKPGKPEASTFYTLLLSKDPDERMPSEADPLPPATIERIRKWIEQGAPWPDGFEIK